MPARGEEKIPGPVKLDAQPGTFRLGLMAMRTLVEAVATAHTPVSLAWALRGQPGLVALHSGRLDVPGAACSIVACRPFARFRSAGSQCTWQAAGTAPNLTFGNPWNRLADFLARYEVLDELDLPFPLGGAFGYFGYELNRFLEPRLNRNSIRELEIPDCLLGFHDSLVVFDLRRGACWIVSTGLDASGRRREERARSQLEWWRHRLEQPPLDGPATAVVGQTAPGAAPAESSMTRADFLAAVRRAQAYIHAGDIYQVNLSQRLRLPCPVPAAALFDELCSVSPAPFAAYIDGGDFQVVSSSPELFLRMSASHIRTRPIKGTRPRSTDLLRDAQWTYELQRSEKEMSELVMITDLLRNDLGRVCEYGSVQVPELVRLERYSHVQHLVSTVEGRLRDGMGHLGALAACFPGGSITGAPKIRAMEIIDELEPVARGPYCGCHGYVGFNRESQFSITIRTAVVSGGWASFHAGAGIVADSVPEHEYDETLAKAAGILAALERAGSMRRQGVRP